jgi:hypothetical protein
MSRMTKFLKQTAVVEFLIRDSNGEAKLDKYGDPVGFTGKVTVKCRRERDTKDVLTNGGSAVVSTTKYFFDNSINVEIGDKVDGKPILNVSDFINDLGISEGWEVTV